jgi:hypothetical protein
MDLINSLMYQNSTLLGAIILIGGLAYVGTNVISPSNITTRRIVGYWTGTLLVLIGAYAFYFGASKEFTLVYAHIYLFDRYRLEWMFIGLLALVVGALLVRQSYRRL